MKPRYSKNDYSIAWIAALAIERAAATALLDEEHEEPLDFEQNEADPNSYSWGLTSGHNIVIASLPAGRYGLTSATTVATGLISSLSHLRMGLLVGIGAAFPECGLDIQLGDVAVSVPEGNSSGVVQYDSGKAKEGSWERCGALAPPPAALLHAVASLQTAHELGGSRMATILNEAATRQQGFRDNYLRPNTDKQATVGDAVATGTQKQQQTHEGPVVHYGTIASGNVLVKDAAKRQAIYTSIGLRCICLEMEAAGLMNAFPCLVIRGICDYADAHKNDLWQRYASATAAAYTKELLLHVTKRAVNATGKLEQILLKLESTLKRIDDRDAQEEGLRKRATNLIQTFYVHSHSERKDRNPGRIPGTCKWFTSHRLFQTWLNEPNANILWASADPGCGKSVLARHLIDDILPKDNRLVLYFFFKDDFEDQRSIPTACSVILHQILCQRPHAVTPKVLQTFEAHGSRITDSFSDTWAIFLEVIQEISDDIFLVIDAFDECENKRRSAFLKIMSTAAQQKSFKLLILSRPYFDIKEDFLRQEAQISVLHLAGDNDEERDQISEEIDLVINHRIADFSRRRNLRVDEQNFLIARFKTVPHRTYLWAYLVLSIIESTPGFTTGSVKRLCSELPADVNTAYSKILQRSTNPSQTKLILAFILAGERSFSVEEMGLLLNLNGFVSNYEELNESIEPLERFRHTLRELCGLFVIIVDGHVYLLHQTAREFLIRQHTQDILLLPHHVEACTSGHSWKSSISHIAANRILAERCLRFIRLAVESRLTGFYQLFYTYCARHWVLHTQIANLQRGDEVLKLAASVCTPPYLFSYQNNWFTKFLSTKGQNQGCDLDQDVLDYIDPGESALQLIVAAYLGLTSLIEYLYDNNALYADEIQSNALHLSICNQHSTSASLVLKNGARANGIAEEWLVRHTLRPDQGGYFDASINDSVDQIPLHCAITFRNFDVVKALLEHGADPNRIAHEVLPGEWLDSFDGSGRPESCYSKKTPIYRAVELHEVDLMEVLLEHHADVNLVCTFGLDTPLHLAARNGWLWSIQMLLEYGANREIVNQSGSTPLDTFIMSHRIRVDGFCQEICSLLWSESCDSTRGPQQPSSFQLAIEQECASCASFLLRQRCGPSKYRHRAPDLFAIAQKRRNINIIHLLKDTFPDIFTLQD